MNPLMVTPRTMLARWVDEGRMGQIISDDVALAAAIRKDVHGA